MKTTCLCVIIGCKFKAFQKMNAHKDLKCTGILKTTCLCVIIGCKFNTFQKTNAHKINQEKQGTKISKYGKKKENMQDMKSETSECPEPSTR